MEKTYNFPVWGTQGGGLVREVQGKHIFVEEPDCPALNIGDEMPEEWDVVPANAAAWRELEREEFGDHSE